MQKSALVYALSFLFCDTLRKSHLWSVDYKNQEKRRILFFVNQVLRDASETCGLVIFPICPAKKHRGMISSFMKNKKGEHMHEV